MNSFVVGGKPVSLMTSDGKLTLMNIPENAKVRVFINCPVSFLCSLTRLQLKW